ncbi:MAG: KpsF/GutQ family sugar-phosphate isomerase [Desulfobulbaceae bacterium]|jgi:arabinose-5-phosphate isomerase|nr:KpsF/GutQ family sugar-phosphate isomerase [Desulfobulbaceae bacterium]
MSIEDAKEVLRIEEEGLTAIRERIGEDFIRAVEMILVGPGRVVITGIGKSGIIGQKIAATMNSTGTPSFFLHPVEAMHGDLGMVMPGDVILAISYSGETAELNGLLIALKERGNRIIAMTGEQRSSLAHAADVVLDIRVPKEACPLGLAPTASTTATLAMGDALAVVLLNRKKFQEEDFRLNHPGGSLGQRLKVRVTEVMFTGKDIPAIAPDASATEAIRVLNEKNMGAVLVVDDTNKVLGIVTDGDIRRAIVGDQAIARMNTAQLMTKNPICIDSSRLAADALSIMQTHEITALPIIDNDRTILGLLHLHNLLGKGEFRFLV